MHFSETEKVLDAEQWKAEANAVINDVKAHVQSLQLCRDIHSSNVAIHLNLTTLEDLQFCVKLSSQGFQVVGHKHNECADEDNAECFETIYGLLDSISPRYRNSFGNSLMEKLKQIARDDDGGSESDS